VITVVIPAYNPGRDLTRALVSLGAQTYTDWSCVVVDDGSATPVAELVEEFGDPRVRVVRHPENRGRGAARVTGLAAVRTPLVAWLDADDWIYTGRLERQLAALADEPGAEFMYAGTMFVGDDEQPIGTSVGASPGSPHTLQGRRRPERIHATLVFRTRVLERVSYSANFRTSEDHAFLMSALREFKYMEVPEILYAYREDQSRSFGKYFNSTVTRLRVTRHLERLRPADRAVMIASYLAKLGAVGGLTAVGLRHLWDKNYRQVPTQAEIAEYNRQVAIQRG